MIADLKPYPEYKESGCRGSGRCRGIGKSARRQVCFAQRNETGYERTSILEVSLKTGVRVRDFESSKRKQMFVDQQVQAAAKATWPIT